MVAPYWFDQITQFGTKDRLSTAIPSGPCNPDTKGKPSRMVEGSDFATCTMSNGPKSGPLCSASQRNFPADVMPVLHLPVGTGELLIVAPVSVTWKMCFALSSLSQSVSLTRSYA